MIPTELEWRRAANAVERLAAKMDDAGKADVSILLDLLERYVDHVCP